ncbi:MAG TPA: ABC transporter transmembrane domain-containing protein, partial [Gemmatimonadaceae bacterium]|nr:ABC transporter transmembrane domain-containing protein [Gemmatimonadaceae bacterium]
MRRARTSRERYRSFVKDYRAGRLDEQTQARADGTLPVPAETPAQPAVPTGSAISRVFGGTRRAYAREYLRWLWPHRYAAAVVFLLALVVAGLEMVQPLFMRAIIDGVLLDTSLDAAGRLQRLNVIGGLFVLLVMGEQVLNVTKNYRQKLLNTHVMLSLRRALFHRLLHLPLPRLWDMKTGGILSRITGDVDTTTGLLQMAVVSPAISLIRLLIAIVILFSLNWQLALTA